MSEETKPTVFGLNEAELADFRALQKKQLAGQVLSKDKAEDGTPSEATRFSAYANRGTFSVGKNVLDIGLQEEWRNSGKLPQEDFQAAVDSFMTEVEIEAHQTNRHISETLEKAQELKANTFLTPQEKATLEVAAGQTLQSITGLATTVRSLEAVVKNRQAQAEQEKLKKPDEIVKEVIGTLTTAKIPINEKDRLFSEKPLIEIFGNNEVAVALFLGQLSTQKTVACVEPADNTRTAFEAEGSADSHGVLYRLLSYNVQLTEQQFQQLSPELLRATRAKEIGWFYTPLQAGQTAYHLSLQNRYDAAMGKIDQRLLGFDTYQLREAIIRNEEQEGIRFEDDRLVMQQFIYYYDAKEPAASTETMRKYSLDYGADSPLKMLFPTQESCRKALAVLAAEIIREEFRQQTNPALWNSLAGQFKEQDTIIARQQMIKSACEKAVADKLVAFLDKISRVASSPEVVQGEHGYSPKPEWKAWMVGIVLKRQQEPGPVAARLGLQAGHLPDEVASMQQTNQADFDKALADAQHFLEVRNQSLPKETAAQVLQIPDSIDSLRYPLPQNMLRPLAEMLDDNGELVPLVTFEQMQKQVTEFFLKEPRNFGQRPGYFGELWRDVSQYEEKQKITALQARLDTEIPSLAEMQLARLEIVPEPEKKFGFETSESKRSRQEAEARNSVKETQRQTQLALQEKAITLLEEVITAAGLSSIFTVPPRDGSDRSSRIDALRQGLNKELINKKNKFSSRSNIDRAVSESEVNTAIKNEIAHLSNQLVRVPIRSGGSGEQTIILRMDTLLPKDIKPEDVRSEAAFTANVLPKIEDALKKKAAALLQAQQAIFEAFMGLKTVAPETGTPLVETLLGVLGSDFTNRVKEDRTSSLCLEVFMALLNGAVQGPMKQEVAIEISNVYDRQRDRMHSRGVKDLFLPGKFTNLVQAGAYVANPELVLPSSTDDEAVNAMARIFRKGMASSAN